SKPTHANIVNAILGLSTNSDIQHGDNIIIYFAGHGTRYKSLCPMDRASPKSTNSANVSEHPVPDISNREINTILTEIACKKGDHITLDCCHSASATR
ncbi:hypothetical protein EDD18DRAFT_1010255, partial [Armillaria luteobubalina]